MSLPASSEVMAPTLGRALRAARESKGLSTRRLATLAGVSQSFLSNVENGRALPSIPSLYALAGGLGMAAAEFLPESFAPLDVTRSGAGTPVALGDHPGGPRDGGSMFRVSGSANHRLDVYELELPPGHREDSALRHPGEDLVYVLEGVLNVLLDDESHLLAAGDSLWWDARRAHTFRVPDAGRESVRAIIVSRALPSGSTVDLPSGVADDDERALAADVGRAVRHERRLRSLTLRELAARAGVSQPFLSNVENGRSLPSVPLLYSIAMALDIAPSRVMPRQARDSHVAHAGEMGRAVEQDPTGSVIAPLSFSSDRLLEAHHLVLQPGFRQPQQLVHRGEDFVYVLGGELLLHVGDESARLRAGDSARFDAQLAHDLSVAASASAPVQALLISAND